MIPTNEFRWNRRTDANPLTFWETTMFGGGKSPRPVGYRLEQKWVHDECSSDDIAEWRPVPFADECMPAEPALDTGDSQFLPVASE